MRPRYSGTIDAHVSPSIVIKLCDLRPIFAASTAGIDGDAMPPPSILILGDTWRIDGNAPTDYLLS